MRGRWIVILGLAGCAATDDGGEPPSEGERIYGSRVEDGNTFACATCHALEEPAADGVRRPGHALDDAAARGTWKNGQLTDLRDAVNSCLVEWMNAEPWSADDPRWLALSDFLGEIAPGSAEPLSFEIALPPLDLSGGDAQTGHELFNRSCAVCHGQDGTGTELALPVADRGLEPAYVAERVRRSGRVDSAVYEGLGGGVMPFWAADRLDDTELRDLVAWLSQGADVAGDGGGDDGSADDGGSGDGEPPPDSGCAQTHDRIGQTAVLEELFHDVGGTAEIVDDCTIVVRDFTFDGAGIDVRFYGGLGGDYDNGFPIGDDLVDPAGYAGVTLTLTLPDGRTLDDMDGLSVWCVDVGVDFGSGTFE